MRRWLAFVVFALFATSSARADRVPTYTVDAKPTTGCTVGMGPYSPINIERSTGRAWKCDSTTGLWEPADLPVCSGGPGSACETGSACQSGTTVLLCPAGTKTAITAGIATAPGSNNQVIRNIGGAQGATSALEYTPTPGGHGLVIGKGESQAELNLFDYNTLNNLRLYCNSSECTICFEGPIALGTDVTEQCVHFANPTADRDLTFPTDHSGTIALVEGPQTYSGTHTFSGSLVVPHGTTPPPCSPANPPIFIDTDAPAGQQLVCCTATNTWGQCNTASVPGAGGGPAQVQYNNAGALGGDATFTFDGSTKEIRTKIINGVRQANAYASNPSASGVLGLSGETTNCWVGWEAGVAASNPREIHFPAGCYVQTTLVWLQSASVSDRQGRFKITGDGMGATVIVPRLAPAWKLGPSGGGTQATYGGVEVGGISFMLDQNLWWDHGIIELEGVVDYNLHDLQVIGGTLLGTGLEFNTFAGYLMEFDSSYTGVVNAVHSYGRYVYLFEIDDQWTTVEQDTMTFTNLFTKGPLMGLVRASTPGTHNLVFLTPKYQTNIELAADTNQYDETTLSSGVAVGATSLPVPSSAAFQAGDPVLLDVGNLLELNKVSSVGGGTITLAHGTRFAHATATQVLHGGVGLGITGTTRLVTLIAPMFEQCASGVMMDAGKWLYMNNVLSTCKEIVQVVGPNSTGGTNGLWNLTIDGAELSLVPLAGTMFAVHVKSSGDSVNNREWDIRHIEKNSSSDDTLVVVQNDAGVSRNWFVTEVNAGSLVEKRNYPAAYTSSLDVNTLSYDGTRVYGLTAAGVPETRAYFSALTPSATPDGYVHGLRLYNEDAVNQEKSPLIVFQNGGPDQGAENVSMWTDSLGTLVTGNDSVTAITSVNQAGRFGAVQLSVGDPGVTNNASCIVRCVGSGNPTGCTAGDADHLFADLNCSGTKDGTDQVIDYSATFGSITTVEIANDTIVDADVSPTAAIAGSKILPQTTGGPGVVAASSGQFNKVWKTDGTGAPSWQPDETGGTPSFTSITAGSNTAALVVTGAGTLTPSGGGTITANAFSGTLPAASVGTGLTDAQVSDTLTIGASSTINAAALPVTTVAKGGTGLTGGTSGGVPYYSGAATIASSAALPVGAIVVGGGAGAAPTTSGCTATATGVTCPTHATDGGVFTLFEGDDDRPGGVGTNQVFQFKIPDVGGIAASKTCELTSAPTIPGDCLDMAQSGRPVGTAFGINTTGGAGINTSCSDLSGTSCSWSTDSIESGFLSDIGPGSCSSRIGAAWVEAGVQGFCPSVGASSTKLYNARGNSSGEATTLADVTLVNGGDSGATTSRPTPAQIVRIRSHDTDCTSLLDGKQGELCINEDDFGVFSCVPSAGDCNTVGEWHSVGTAASPEVQDETYNGTNFNGDTNHAVSQDDLFDLRNADIQTLSVVLLAPTSSDDPLIFKAPYGMTVTHIDCIVGAATSAQVTLLECSSTGTSCTDTVEAAITCDADGAAEAGGSIDAPTISSGGWLKLDIGTVTGTVGQVSVTVTYTVVQP